MHTIRSYTMTNFEWLRDRLLSGIAGLKPDRTYEEIRQASWSYQFERFMRQRLIMGSIRYGGGLNDPDKPAYDCLGAIAKRLQEYERTGNDELLVDIANLAMVEFEEGFHPKKHFHAKERNEQHTGVKKK